MLLVFLSCPASAQLRPDLTLNLSCFLIKKKGGERKFKQLCFKISFTDAFKRPWKY